MSLEVSFIIPTYRRLNYLDQAIESILMQSLSKTEIIVIDDDPTSENGKKLIKKYGNRIRYYKNDKNQGPGFCRKLGLEVSKGEFVVFMDDDDYYIKNNFLETAVNFLKNYKSFSFIGFSVNDFFEKDKKLVKPSLLKYDGNISGAKFLKHFGFKYNKPTSTFATVFRKSSLIKGGVLDVGMLNDTVIYLRALLEGDAYIDQTIIGNYRHHENNITKTISMEFIVKNIEEKERVSDLLPYNYITRNYWLYKQSWYSIAYYILNHQQNMNLGVLRKWVSRQQVVCRFLITCRLFLRLLKLRLRNSRKEHTT